ncbi:hypothetical protein QBC43DRAFT_309839 [Cladorrhinum sp. PSN259]|nr:hypothetical protein QBC43DRAFT_309839 [Cladorrhinum sp. PSN259]
MTDSDVKPEASKLADVDGGPLIASDRSIFGPIERGLIKNPDAPAVICMHQSPDHLSSWTGVVDIDPSLACLTLTYAQLHQGALKLASGLVASGAQPGQVILCMIQNGGEYALLLWASAILRLTLSAVDPAVLDKNNTSGLKDYLQLLKPDVIVVPTPDESSVVDAAYLELSDNIRPPTIRLLAQHEANDNFQASGWTSLLATARLPKGLFSESATLEQARLDDTARTHSIYFTSGTSAGMPKGCPLTVGSTAHILTSQSWLITGPTASRVLQQAHNSRAIGPQHTLQTWRAGGAVVMPTGPSFAVEHTIEAIAVHHVSFIVVTPAMVHALAGALPSLSTAARDAVRTIQVGGDVVTRDVLVKTAALFPNAKVCVNHGMSEGGAFFEWPFFEIPPDRIPYFGEICPAGKVTEGARVKIWDAREGRVAAVSQPGELHVSCESLIPGYLNGVDAAAFYVDGGGVRWMNTGDIAIMTEENLVYILGRSKDAISNAGTIIMPAAVESCIDKYTGSQSCVVGLSSSPLGGQEGPFAVVSNLEGITKDQVISQVKNALGIKFGIRGVASLGEIGLDRFPVNATYKIVRFEVQKALVKFMGDALMMH